MNIRNKIIKYLGGYTEEEYRSANNRSIKYYERIKKGLTFAKQNKLDQTINALTGETPRGRKA